MQKSDPDWLDVAALQGGDDTALDRLMERHSERLYGFVRRMIGNASDAEEIAQETFVRAYFQIQRYRPQAVFTGWLYQIARNLCRDYFRSRAYKERAVSFELSRLPVEPRQKGERSNVQEERIEVVQAALMKLPCKLRECLILTAIEGLSHAEVGHHLGLTVKAVEVRNYRARRLLRELLKNL